jgi:hypothetical protein
VTPAEAGQEPSRSAHQARGAFGLTRGGVVGTATFGTTAEELRSGLHVALRGG